MTQYSPGLFDVTTGTGADQISVGHTTVIVEDFVLSGAEADRLDLSYFQHSGDYLYYLSPLTFDNGGLHLAQQGADALVEFADGTPIVTLKSVDAAQITAATFSGLDPGPIWTRGSAGGDALSATSSPAHIEGLAGNDTLTGGASGDALLGGDGADVIRGGQGGDTLSGGAGADTFVYDSPLDSVPSGSGGATYDMIGDFTSGQDRLDLSATGAQVIELDSFASGVANVFFTAGAGSPVGGLAVHGSIVATDIVAPAGARFVFADSGGGYQSLTGTAGADTFLGQSGDAIDSRGGADDFVFGSPLHSAVTLYGAGADDVIDLTGLHAAEHGAYSSDLTPSGGSSTLTIHIAGLDDMYVILSGVTSGAQEPSILW